MNNSAKDKLKTNITYKRKKDIQYQANQSKQTDNLQYQPDKTKSFFGKIFQWLKRIFVATRNKVAPVPDANALQVREKIDFVDSSFIEPTNNIENRRSQIVADNDNTLLSDADPQDLNDIQSHLNEDRRRSKSTSVDLSKKNTKKAQGRRSSFGSL